MRLRQFWQTIPAGLNWTAFLAVVLLLSKVFLFNRIPAPNPAMPRLGVVVEGVLGSAIASYVFYLLAVHLKHVQDKRSLYPFVLHLCRGVVSDCEDLFEEIAKAVAGPVPLPDLSAAELKELLLGVAFEDSTSKVTEYGPANWYDVHSYIRKRSHDRIGTVLVQAPFLDSRLISLLIRIDECTYFKYGEDFAVKPKTGGGRSMMHTISGCIVEYRQLCRELSLLVDSLSIWEQRGLKEVG